MTEHNRNRITFSGTVAERQPSVNPGEVLWLVEDYEHTTENPLKFMVVWRLDSEGDTASRIRPGDEIEVSGAIMSYDGDIVMKGDSLAVIAYSPTASSEGHISIEVDYREALRRLLDDVAQQAEDEENSVLLVGHDLEIARDALVAFQALLESPSRVHAVVNSPWDQY